MSEETMTHEPKRHPIDFGGQGRQAGGYSLRKSLENQGVTTEEDMRKHMTFVYNMLNSVAKSARKVDITRYRK